jgi:hypothetical protein
MAQDNFKRWHNQIEMFRDAGLIHYFQGGAANG